MTDAIRKARDDLKAALYARENNTTTMVGQLNKFASASRSALSAIDAALEGGAVPKVREPVRWPQPGDNMRFLAENGYDHELAAAKAIFQKNDIVTVRRCDVGSYSHTVWFEGHEQGFNGVMFELLPSPPTGA